MKYIQVLHDDNGSFSLIYRKNKTCGNNQRLELKTVHFPINFEGTTQLSYASSSPRQPKTIIAFAYAALIFGLELREGLVCGR